MIKRLAQIDYRTQKRRACERGISWLFTFDEWIKWWEDHLGPDWQSKRGKCRGQYVMARFGDLGPYSPENVECILASENSRRANTGENSIRAIVTNQIALGIFMTSGTNQEVADLFGVKIGIVSAIKRRAAYKDATNGLTHPKRKRGLEGDKHPGHKLTDENVKFIRSTSKTARELAAIFKVSRGHIYDIRNNRRRTEGQSIRTRTRIWLTAPYDVTS